MWVYSIPKYLTKNASIFRRNADLTPYAHGQKRGMRRAERARSPEIQMPFIPGGFDSAKRLKNFEGHIIISERYGLDAWLKFVNDNPDLMPKIMISSGDFQYLLLILRNVKEIELIHIPFERIYYQGYEDFVNKVRRNFPTRTILIGSGSKDDIDAENGLKTFLGNKNKRRKVLRFDVPVVLEKANEREINHDQGTSFEIHFTHSQNVGSNFSLL